MNLIQRIKAAFIPSQGSDAGNKYNQSLFSYFNGIFFNIPNNPRAYVRSGYQGNPDVFDGGPRREVCCCLRDLLFGYLPVADVSQW